MKKKRPPQRVHLPVGSVLRREPHWGGWELLLRIREADPLDGDLGRKRRSFVLRHPGEGMEIHLADWCIRSVLVVGLLGDMAKRVREPSVIGGLVNALHDIFNLEALWLFPRSYTEREIYQIVTKWLNAREEE